jgi:hypothetical protein
VVAALDQLNENGETPPATDKEAVPLHKPHEGENAEVLVVICAPELIVAACVLKQPFASITEAEYVPLHKPLINADVWLLLQLTEYGLVPPFKERSITPLQFPKQRLFVKVGTIVILVCTGILMMLVSLQTEL